MKALLTLFFLLTQMAQAISVEVPNYFGNRPLKAAVSENGTVEVLNYPKTWLAQLQIVQWNRTGLYHDLSEMTCQTVRLQSKEYATLPPLARERLRESVRQATPVRIKMNLAENFQPRMILSAIRKALTNLGIDPLSLNLKNRMTLQDAKFRITISPSAITKNIGELRSVEMELSRQFRDGILQLGVMTGDFNAMDLLCDLKSEEATLEVELATAAAATAQATPIMEFAKAKRLMNLFVNATPRFSTGVQFQEFGKNRILATSLVYEYFQENRDFDLTLAIEKLTDPKTGIPLPMDDETLNDAITVFTTGTTTETATVSLNLVEEER